MNKGLRQKDYMSQEKINKTKATRFKPRHKPHNTKFDGCISTRKDQRTGRTYLYIRLSEGKWKEYHLYIWEKHHGSVPPKHVIRFVDGNTMNCTLKNLECITMAANSRRNSNWEKAMETMKKKKNRASVDLTDNYVAGMVTGHDKELKEYILQHRPDIIRAARANYKLQRAIKWTEN